ncbi:uncharacterized protein LOC124933795 [Impatiens glandulifera]|uniref:uncharacterized protein LOC124933795 n=1 Tax=Impatiens glandulifera TaxID=253017 RepID=UPI001FB14A9D|nr:uncharacterized protein LOC124933795 [Impatiens glandulifera]
MANKIPVRFKRVAAAFEEEVARARFSESSGSEHSPEEEELMNLSDLVDSFMEREYGKEEPERNVEDELEICDSYLEMKEELEKLLGYNEEDDEMKKNIRAEVERVYGDCFKEEEKRGLMIKLRHSGFDAGLCKSKWEKTGKYPSGSYEYIDIKESNNDREQRYIIEINLVNEFAIARPTKFYSSLLDLFPSIFVGKAEDLKKIVRLMFKGMKDSLNKMDMSMPPWRRHGYQQAKWFSGFRRTVNEFPIESGSDSTVALKRRWVGFEPVDFVSSGCNCKKNLSRGRVGLLALALNS